MTDSPTSVDFDFSLATSLASPPLVNPQPPSQEPAEPRNARRRVLHVINGEHYSGAERVQDLLAACLPEFGYDVGFACIKPGRFLEARKTTETPVHACAMRSRFDFRAIGQLCELVDRHGYELVHAHTPRSVMVGKLVASRRRLPFVYHVHSPTINDSTSSWRNRINSMTERLSLTGVAKLITVSDSLAVHMRTLGFESDQIAIVPNGVPSVATATRRVPSTSWVLGTVALFRPRKGTEMLLEALRRLRDQGHDVRLRAVGGFETDDYRKQLIQLVDKLELQDAVDWLGFQRDVNAELAKVDLFVLPSLFGEGMPMVVLEAMATGLPVIGTYVEGVPEVVRDGLEGRLVDPGDPRGLADAIATVIDGEFCWQAMSEHARARHAAQYSDRSMAGGVAAVYDSILGPLPSRAPGETRRGGVVPGGAEA